jgi:hypothetical protein
MTAAGVGIQIDLRQARTDRATSRLRRDTSAKQQVCSREPLERRPPLHQWPHKSGQRRRRNVILSIVEPDRREKKVK